MSLVKENTAEIWINRYNMKEEWSADANNCRTDEDRISSASLYILLHREAEISSKYVILLKWHLITLLLLFNIKPTSQWFKTNLKVHIWKMVYNKILIWKENKSSHIYTTSMIIHSTYPYRKKNKKNSSVRVRLHWYTFQWVSIAQIQVHHFGSRT